MPCGLSHIKAQAAHPGFNPPDNRWSLAMKTEVLTAIGADGLRRPAAVNAALAANDRVKYAFSLLQMAAAHADQPSIRRSACKRERLAAGIDDAALDGLTADASRSGRQLPDPRRRAAC